MAEPIEYGPYIVADPRICHGKLTFRGTRIMVKSIVVLLPGNTTP